VGSTPTASTISKFLLRSPVIVDGRQPQSPTIFVRQWDRSILSHRLRDTSRLTSLERSARMDEGARLPGHAGIKTTERSNAKWSKGHQDTVDALVTGT